MGACSCVSSMGMFVDGGLGLVDGRSGFQQMGLGGDAVPSARTLGC